MSEVRSVPLPLTASPKSLTPRETDVLIGIAQGRANKETASVLGISVKTVDTHRGKLLKKLGLRHNADLARYAIKHGFIDVDGGVIGAAEAVDETAAGQATPIAQPGPAIAQAESGCARKRYGGYPT